MDYPIKVFEIKGFSNEYIKLEITQVFGFPKETSFRGGYEIKCNLEISSGLYKVYTDCYYSDTAELYKFYIDLLKCYNKLSGIATYQVRYSDNNLTFDVTFAGGKVKIVGQYQDNPLKKDILYFEFNSDQSYFKEVLSDLKKLFYSLEIIKV